MTSRKDRTHIRPQPEDVMGDGLEELKDARFSPLLDAGKKIIKFYHHTLPLKFLSINIAASIIITKKRLQNYGTHK